MLVNFLIFLPMLQHNVTFEMLHYIIIDLTDEDL